MLNEDEVVEILPYPDTFVIRIWDVNNMWYCTLRGRLRNDAPYWHGKGESAGEAFEDAFQKTFLGFEGEGIRVEPTT